MPKLAGIFLALGFLRWCSAGELQINLKPVKCFDGTVPVKVTVMIIEHNPLNTGTVICRDCEDGCYCNFVNEKDKKWFEREDEWIIQLFILGCTHEVSLAQRRDWQNFYTFRCIVLDETSVDKVYRLDLDYTVHPDPKLDHIDLGNKEVVLYDRGFCVSWYEILSVM